MIYLDNAATTKPCAECCKAVIDTMENLFGNASSLHRLGTASMLVMSKAKRSLVSALGKTTFTGDVLFVSGATEANNTALLGVAENYSRTGKKIISTAIEHPSVAKVLDKLEESGFEVVRLSPKDYDDFSQAILDAVDENTMLVSCMAVNNETGFKTDVCELYKRIKKKNAKTIVHIDAVQGFLKMPLDGDLISVSGHKVHASKGIGALFVRKGVRVAPLLAGGGQQGGIRSGTEPVELIAGFDAAVSAYKGTADGFAKLKDYLLGKLAEIDDIGINSDEKCVPNIVNFSVRGVRSEIMLHSLEEDWIYVSSGSACSKGKKSGVLSALGVSDKDADCAIRVSFSSENTTEDIDRLCEKLAATIARVRR